MIDWLVKKIDPLLDWTDRLFNIHGFMRRFTMFWAMGLITVFGWVLLQQGEFTEKMYIAMVGMLATAVGLYTWTKK